MDSKLVLENTHKIRLTFGIAWDKTFQNTRNKQTLFPVYPERKSIDGSSQGEWVAQQGKPDEVFDKTYTLRATKAVNMFPYPFIQIQNVDGTPYTKEEEVKLSVVSAESEMPPGVGTCPCDKDSPKLQESQEFQLKIDAHSREVRATIKGGKIEFHKLQIGCCTGNTRGHGGTFRLKIEFCKPNSPLFGKKLLSRQIEVAAKGPFAKINCVAKRLRESEAKKEEINVPSHMPPMNMNTTIALPSSPSQILVMSPPTSNPPSTMVMGTTEIFRLLKIFKEIDPRTLQKMSDERMMEMAGIVSRMTYDTSAPLALEMLPALLETQESAQSLLMPASPTVSQLSPVSPTSAAWNDFQVPDQPDTSKRRRIAEAPPVFEGPLCVYIYLATIVMGRSNWKKVLFMVRSRRNQEETNRIVNLIQREATEEAKKRGKRILDDTRDAQLMLALQPGKNNEWVALSLNQTLGKIWNFQEGDYIKIENRHSWDVDIVVHHYTILDEPSPAHGRHYEEYSVPSKYPRVFPNGALEIGIDDNKEGKVDYANKSNELGEIFAVTKHGQILPSTGDLGDACLFQLKRRKTQMIKNDSYDDFLQKEEFVSKCYAEINSVAEI